MDSEEKFSFERLRVYQDSLNFSKESSKKVIFGGTLECPAFGGAKMNYLVFQWVKGKAIRLRRIHSRVSFQRFDFFRDQQKKS